MAKNDNINNSNNNNIKTTDTATNKPTAKKESGSDKDKVVNNKIKSKLQTSIKSKLANKTKPKKKPSQKSNLSSKNGEQHDPTQVAIIPTLTKKEYRKLQKDISKLPSPSFNNPDKVQTVVDIPKPITSEIEKTLVDTSKLETQERQLVDTRLTLDTSGAKLEKFHRPRNVKTLKVYLQFVKKHLPHLLLCLLFALIYSTFELMIPLFLGEAIDTIVGVNQVNFALLQKNILYLALSIIGFAGFRWLTVFFNNILSFKTDRTVRIAVFKKINKAPLKYIDGTSHGDLQSRMINDVDEASNGLLLGVTTIFDALVSIVLTIVIMFSINTPISIAIIALTPISVISTAIIAYRSNKYFRRQAKLLGDASGHIVEMISNQRIVKAFNYEDKSIEDFEKINKQLAEQNEKAMFYSSLSNPSSRFINGVIYGIVAIMGILFAIDGKLSIGKVSVLLSFANKYIQPFNEISDVFSDLQSAYASAKRVVNVLELNEEVSDKDNAVLKRSNGNVELKGVDFSYVPTKKLIENLNLKISKGQRVAIVGPTGSGKSTIINLLMRFYDVNKGEVLVSDKNITTITRDSLRDKFGMVLQESYLFNMSIKDNIKYGKPEATDEEVVKAAKKANAHEYIQTLENGYDTIVTEGGENLSQGQKQLVCIARIMLTNPPMLILDEATSNIDTRTELHIQNAFNKMMKGRTSFIVAHRLSTIINSDVILVMNRGNIVEQGTHKQLLEQQGFYYTLYNSQFSKV